jgi:hypothetical protein
MADAAYEAVVKETFQNKPLRTVLMVDDEFPTFADLAKGETTETANRFAQKDRAAKLYEAFQRSHMICDIENVGNQVEPERLRKSDLVVLDYHLGPGHNNSERAIEILRALSISKHFNTVVVYTAEPDLDKVWLEIAAGVSGSWTTLPAGLTGDAKDHWERLSDAGTLPEATKDAMMAYAKRRDIRSLPHPVQTSARQELTDLGVPQTACSSIIEALIHRGMAQRAGRYAAEPEHRTVGDYGDAKRWIQSGSVFITIVQKGELTEDECDPAGILAGLTDALLAWRPNLIQILVSEIQNILESEALASEDDLLRDPVTQTALWYYLIENLGPTDPHNPPDVKIALMAVVDKIVDGVRRRMSSDPALLLVASNALVGELKDAGWTAAAWPTGAAAFKGAIDLARTKGMVTQTDALFRLNSFSSSERFGRAHLTTGTIFRHHTSDQYFVATSPACDLVARPPSVDQLWARVIHPHTPMVAVMLQPTSIEAALSEAAQGKHIFFEHGSDKKAFKVVAGSGNQPPYQFFILRNEGRVRQNEGRMLFDASQLQPRNEEVGGVLRISPSERDWVDETFEIVAQLRGINATHILQLAGQHLSRIGLDFINTPKP